MSEAKLELIELALLDDHPKNPRVCLREDVVDGIVENLGDEWPQKHALSVRPLGNRFQVVSGHHRKQAATNKGIEKVWCWVEEMDDDKAFMELATANNQGELDPLEIGIHAFEAIPVSKGGRGNVGGISGYAKAIGKPQPNVSKYRNAGQVAKAIHQCIGLLGKANQLAEIYKLPKECWECCCEWVVEKSLSSFDVKEAVVRAKEPSLPSHPFLPEKDCTVALFRGSHRVSDFERLGQLAEKVHKELENHKDLQEQWDKWLIDNKGDLSWDIGACQSKRIELETEVWDREHSKKEQDEVNLIVADPPWQYDHAKQNRAIENHYPTAPADEIATHLELPWVPPIAEDCVLFMWTTAPKLQEAFTVLDGWGFTYKTHAIWDKERLGMGYWFRSRHELLLVATKGKPPTPEEGDRLPSVFQIKRDNKHSKKPSAIYEAIESMFPDAVKFEMYAREQREGWVQGGNESGA